MGAKAPLNTKPMNELEVIEVARSAIWTLIIIASPIMMVALIVGLLISLFQALTQIQEMTLSFVPKILAVFMAMVLVMPFIIHTLTDFSDDIFRRVSEVGKNDREMPQ